MALILQGRVRSHTALSRFHQQSVNYMKIKSPFELLADQIRDLHNVEIQVAGTMPELAAQAYDPGLRDFLQSQHEFASGQQLRLRQVAEIIGSDADGDVCKAMEGLIEGGNKHVAIAQGALVTDLILVAHVSRIFQYQIAGYGFATRLAEHLKLVSAESLLSSSLIEEHVTAESLEVLSQRFFQTVEERAE